MGKLACSCGNVISNCGFPSPSNGLFIRDDQLDLHLDGGVNVLDGGREVWECGSCGRIAFSNNNDNVVKWYSPVDGNNGNLCNFEV